jgi:hypothetical protein
MALLLKWIFKLLKIQTKQKSKIGIFKKTSQQVSTSSFDVTQSIIQSNSQDILNKTQEVRDISYFSRINNLVAKFRYTPTSVHNSPNDKTPMGWLDENGKIILNKDHDGDPKVKIYKGYVIRYFNKAELDNHITRIEYKLKEGLVISEYLTENEYEILKEAEVLGNTLLADDVEFLKSDPNYAKPDLKIASNENKTYTITPDPYLVQELLEFQKQQEKVSEKLQGKLGVPIDNEDQGKITNELSYKDFSEDAGFEKVLDKCKDEDLVQELKDHAKAREDIKEYVKKQESKTNNQQ